MPIASQVKSLAEEIEASYGARVGAVSDIIKETESFLGSSHRAHQKMASQLRDSLSSGNSTRASEVRKMRTNNVKELKETAQSLKEAAQKLGQWLSSSDKERLKEFAHVFGEIKATVGGIEKGTAKLLSDYRGSHKEMAANLRGSLTRGTKDRINQVRNLMSAARDEHKEQTNLLRRNLSSFQRNLAKTVGEMRKDNANDQRSARTHWQNLAKMMTAKRAGKPIPKPQAPMGVPEAVKEVAEEAFKTGELKVRVLEVLQAHPGGMTLSQIGKALNVAYIRVAKPLKELIMEMRATKRNSEYFPA